MRGLPRLGVSTLGAQCRDVIIFVLVVTGIQADGFHHSVNAEGRVEVSGNHEAEYGEVYMVRNVLRPANV